MDNLKINVEEAIEQIIEEAKGSGEFSSKLWEVILGFSNAD